ncbi:MAG: hypothetical protein JSR82_20350 [Verrucomicrobia bacterium]|nr:hypothetical protein [Verrucomicrobiota bacterium]
MRCLVVSALTLCALLAPVAHVQAESFALEPTFQRPQLLSDPASATRARPDSQDRVYVSGDLTGANGQRLGRVIRISGATGAIDPTFVVGRQFAAVRAIMVDSSDRLIVSGVLAGESTSDGSTERLFRVLPDGSIDPTFNTPRFRGPITLMRETTSGKILAVVLTDVFANGLIRLNTDGSIDSTFTPLFVSGIQTEPVTDSNGLILVGGTFNFGGKRGIVRLTSTGDIDNTFVPPNNTVIQSPNTSAIALQSDGKIVLCGLGYRVGGFSSQMLRLTMTGAVDTTFVATNLGGGSFGARPRSAFVLSDNRLIVAGQFVARVGANGGVEATFFTNNSLGFTSPTFSSHSLGRRPNGTFVLATGTLNGRVTLDGGGTMPSLYMFDGTLGPALGFTPPSLERESYSVRLALQAGARVAYGTIDRLGSRTGTPLVRLQLAGTADPTFLGPGIALWQQTLSASTDAIGRIFATYNEDFTVPAIVGPTKLVRLATNGRVEATLNPTPAVSSNATVFTAPDGKLLLGRTLADFQAVLDGVPGLRRLQPDGTTDTTWAGPTGYEQIVRDGDTISAIYVGGIVVHAAYPEGRLLVTSQFIAPNLSTYPSFLSRLLPNGSFDPAFSGPSVAVPINSINGAVYRYDSTGFEAVDLGPDGSIVAAGAFTEVSYFGNPTPIPAPGIVKVRGDGSLDPAFNAGTGTARANGLPARIHRVRIAPDGKIWLIGLFDRFNGTAVPGIVRLNVNGSVDATASFPVEWVDFGADQADISFETDGRVYLTGAFAQPAEKVPFSVVLLKGSPLVPLPTATPIPIPTPSPTPTPTATPSPTPTPSPTATPTPTVTPTPTPRAAYLRNVSTRLFAGTGDNVPIAGFAVRAGAQRIAIRAIGPTLANFGVADVMADPTLELRDAAGALVATNDNYTTLGGLEGADLATAGLIPSNPLESALVATLSEGTYTAIVRGKDGGVGNCLVEVYEIGPFSPPPIRLVNLSTRGQVGTGDRVMIGGFVVGGTTPRRFLVRSLGPSLAAFQVPNVLADPMIELNAGPTLLGTNDNWQSTQQAEIAASGFAPTDPAEAAMIVTLGPGSYTAIVRGKNATTGNAIVEVYELP